MAMARPHCCCGAVKPAISHPSSHRPGSAWLRRSWYGRVQRSAQTSGRGSHVVYALWGRNRDQDAGGSEVHVKGRGVKWEDDRSVSDSESRVYTTPTKLIASQSPEPPPAPVGGAMPWVVGGATFIVAGYMALKSTRSWATKRWKATLQEEGQDTVHRGSTRSLDMMADVATDLMGIEKKQMSTAVMEVKGNEEKLQKAKAMVEEMKVKANTMQQKLRAQLAEREAELKLALETVEALEAEVEAVGSVVKAQEAEIDAVQRAATEHSLAAQSALDESQRRVALLEAMVGTLRNQLTEEETKNSGLAQKVREGEEALASANSQVAEMEDQVVKLEGQLAEAEAKWREASARSAGFCLQLEVAEKEQRKLLSSLDDLESNARIQADAAGKAAKEADSRIKEATAQSQLAQAKLAEIEDELDTAQKALQDAQEAAAQVMAAKVADMAKMEEDWKEEQRATKTVLQRKEREVQEREAELNEAYRKLKVKEGEVDDVRKEMKAAQEDIESARQLVLVREEEIGKMHDDVKRLETELQASEEELTQAEKEGGSKIEALNLQIQRRQAELDATRRALEESGQSAEEQATLMAAREQDLAKARHLVLQRETELEGVRALVKQRDLRMRESEARTKESEASVMRLKALVSEREAGLRRLQDIVAEKETVVSTTQRQLSQAREKAMAEAEARAAEVAAVRAELQPALATAREQLQGQRSQLEKMREQYDMQLKQLADELQEAKAKTAEEEAAELARDKLVVKINKAKSELRMCEGLITQLEGEACARLPPSAQDLEAKLAQEIKALKAEVDKAESEELCSQSQQKLEDKTEERQLLLKSVLKGDLAQKKERLLQQLDDARKAVEVLGPVPAEASRELFLKGAMEELKDREARLAEREASLAALPEDGAGESENAAMKQLEELLAFQDEMKTQQEGMEEMRKKYEAEVKLAQERASQAAEEAEALRSTVKERDAQLSAAQTNISSATSLVIQELENRATAQRLISPLTPPSDTTSTPPPPPSPPPAAAEDDTTADKGEPGVGPAKSKAAANTAKTQPKPDSAAEPKTVAAAASGAETKPELVAKAPPAPEARSTSIEELADALWSSKPTAASTNGSSRPRSRAAANRLMGLTCAGFMIPHPAKAEKGGEDAFFVSPAQYDEEKPWLGAFGVADGVGGWGEDGVDPAAYANTLMNLCESMVGPFSEEASPQKVMDFAHRNTDMEGSATACIMMLKPKGTLVAANIGDCGFRIVRDGEVVLKSKSQQHEFNMPFQLGYPEILPETDYAKDAELYSHTVKVGDIIVAGSDGIFDNMWDNQLCEIVQNFLKTTKVPLSEDNVKELASKLAEMASTNAASADYRSPFAVEAANTGAVPLLARLFPRGGKVDDTTVVVAFVDSLRPN